MSHNINLRRSRKINIHLLLLHWFLFKKLTNEYITIKYYINNSTTRSVINENKTSVKKTLKFDSLTGNFNYHYEKEYISTFYSACNNKRSFVSRIKTLLFLHFC